MLIHPVRQGLAVAATTLIVVIAGACYSIYSDHQEAVQNHRVLLRDLADVVAEHTTQSILRTDSALSEIRDAVLLAGGPKQFSTQAQWGELQRMSERIPGVVGVVLADPEGRVVATSTRFPAPSMSVANRGYMRTLAQGDVLDIGAAVASRIKPGEVVYTINRRLLGRRGELIGVVSAEISTHYLTDFYGLVGASTNVLIEVCGVNGDLLARKPAVLEYVGRNLADSPLFSRDIPVASEGSTEFRSPLDKVDRLAAWKVLAPYPLVIVVGLEMNMVEEHWRQRTERNAVRVLVGLMIIAVATFWSIARPCRRARRPASRSTTPVSTT